MAKQDAFTYTLTRDQVRSILAGQDTMFRIAASQMQNHGLQAGEEAAKKQQEALALASLLSAPLLKADAAKAKAAEKPKDDKPPARKQTSRKR